MTLMSYPPGSKRSHRSGRRWRYAIYADLDHDDHSELREEELRQMVFNSLANRLVKVASSHNDSMR